MKLSISLCLVIACLACLIEFQETSLCLGNSCAAQKKATENELELVFNFHNLDELRKALEESPDIRKLLEQQEINSNQFEIQSTIVDGDACSSETSIESTLSTTTVVTDFDQSSDATTKVQTTQFEHTPTPKTPPEHSATESTRDPQHASTDEPTISTDLINATLHLATMADKASPESQSPSAAPITALNFPVTDESMQFSTAVQSGSSTEHAMASNPDYSNELTPNKGSGITTQYTTADISTTIVSPRDTSTPMVETTSDPCTAQQTTANPTNETCPIFYGGKCYTVVTWNGTKKIEDAKTQCTPADICDYCHFKEVTQYLGKDLYEKNSKSIEIWTGMTANSSEKKMYLSSGEEVTLPSIKLKWSGGEYVAIRGTVGGDNYLFVSLGPAGKKGVLCNATD
ncbi:uncharacterized protein LOC120337477 [Styela clava]